MLPAATLAALAVLSTDRSALDATVIVSVLVLFALLASAVVVVTVLVAFTGPLPGTVKVSVCSTVCPGAKLPSA